MGDAPPADLRAEEAERRRRMLARVEGRIRMKAEIAFPAVPSLASHYTETLADHFAALGRPFSSAELETLQRTLLLKLHEAHAASLTSSVLVRYETAEDGSKRIDYGVAASVTTLAEQYEHWVKTREPPLFGAHPDARVMAEIGALAAGSRVLDIGAGTGRNTLPIARLGFEVDAIEPAPALADVLENEARAAELPVHVRRSDARAARDDLPAGRFALAIASEVTSHFRGTVELRAFFRTAATALRAGGKLVANAFVTTGGYRPDTFARELGQLFWTTFYTPAELATALEGVPLRIVEDIDALEYEQSHLPPEAWPPTGWFAGWARGEDVFGPGSRSVTSLRWLVLERTQGAVPED